MDENNKQETEKHEIEDPSHEDYQDEDVAEDNLAFAESIYVENLKDYLISPSESRNAEEKTNKGVVAGPVPEDVKSLLFGLSEVYHKMGDLETCKSDFHMAVEKYQKALKIRKEHDSKFSRITAEIYFTMAKVFDFDAKQCLTCFVKARIIMEYHIKQKLIESGKADLADKIEIDESLLDTEEVDYKSIKTKNDLYYENEQFVKETLPSNILDLADIIKQLDVKVIYIMKKLNFSFLFSIFSKKSLFSFYIKLIKVEDVIIDIDSFHKIKITQEIDKINEPQVQTNFTAKYDETMVVDAKAMGLVKKRERKDLEKPVFTAAKQENQSENIQSTDENAYISNFAGTKVFKHEEYEEKINQKEEN